MNDWVKNNLWSLLIAAVTIVSTYSLYGYKIADQEKQIASLQGSIAALNIQQVQTQVALAQIAVDLSYIKASIDRINK